MVLATDGAQRVPDDWYVGFHRGLAARFWRAAGATMADDDARVVRGLLGADVRSVLDAPCGDGRITIRLAAAGYAAIGVDLIDDEVAHAREAARRAGVAARFLVGDLRALPDVGPVDALVCWGNSFGYLTPADTARSLVAMHGVLRPGGRLVLESLTVAESLLVAGIRPRAEYEFGGIRMTSTNRYRVAESRLESDLVFEDADGRVEHARSAHRVHTSGEVVRLVQAAGFGDVELLAGDGASAYELGSSRLIVVATR
jgi:SAM-dependent methyltransferase